MSPGLYVHIPFCLKKCHYCNFAITVDRSDSMRQRFLTALKDEIREQAAHYGRLSFDTIYFGGGTPSALDAGELRQIVECLRKYFDFKPGAEWTLEINPGDVDLAKLKSYRALGINRISMGVQTFDEALLAKLNRPHGLREILETSAHLRETGFENVSLDLIARLPGQDTAAFSADIQQALVLKPAQFSIYDLEIHAETAFGAWQQQGRLTLTDEAGHAQMIGAAEDLLEEQGYIQYALGAFAKAGFESRHNLNYWHNGDYLGLGPGAFSYLEGERFQFAPDVKRYLEKCAGGDWQPDVCDRLTEQEREKENLLTGLRLREGAFVKNFQGLLRQIKPRIDFLSTKGLLEQTAERLVLTRQGRFLFESVSAELV